MSVNFYSRSIIAHNDMTTPVFTKTSVTVQEYQKRFQTFLLPQELIHVYTYIYTYTHTHCKYPDFKQAKQSKFLFGSCVVFLVHVVILQK